MRTRQRQQQGGNGHQRAEGEVVEAQLRLDQRREAVDAFLAAGMLPENQHQPLHDHRTRQHRQREVGAFEAQRRQADQQREQHRHQHRSRQAPPAVEAEARVHETGGVGADANEQAVAEVLASGEARHEVPGHGPDAVDHADGQYADQVVAAEDQRQQGHEGDKGGGTREIDRFVEHIRPGRATPRGRSAPSGGSERSKRGGVSFQNAARRPKMPAGRNISIKSVASTETISVHELEIM